MGNYITGTKNNNASSRILNLVEVTNLMNRKVKVRVDCDRSTIQCTFAELQCDATGGGVSRKLEYEVYHVVDTANSFTTIANCATMNFHPAQDGGDHAFLTVLVEDGDGSWFTSCENHGICRRGKVFLGHNIYTKQSKLHYYHDHKLGRIHLYNRSSKRIWARIDSDRIAIVSVKQQVSANVGFASASAMSSQSTKLYYRAGQKTGYTMVENHGDNDDYTVFYIAVPTNQFFLSLDYENSDGKLVTHCLNHPQHYRMMYSWEEKEIVPTPDIYVTDEEMGNEDEIKFTIDRC